MNQKEIRAEFWTLHHSASRKDCAETRVAFCSFIDNLARAGRISEALAKRATLRPTTMRIVWRVMGNYGQGWEELSECDSRRVAIEELREYRIACPQGSHKISRGRVPV